MADPYDAARRFGERNSQMGENAQSRAQQLLLNVFLEEAARQRPMVNLPIDLASQVFQASNMEPFKEAAAARQRRYGTKKDDDEEATTETGSTVNADGSETITVGDKTYTIPKGS